MAREGGINGKSFTANKAGFHATTDNLLKNLTQHIAVTETPVAIGWQGMFTCPRGG